MKEIGAVVKDKDCLRGELKLWYVNEECLLVSSY